MNAIWGGIVVLIYSCVVHHQEKWEGLTTTALFSDTHTEMQENKLGFLSGEILLQQGSMTMDYVTNCNLSVKNGRILC